MTMGCTEYCKDFTAALKTIDVIDKKQMYDSVITRKEYASEYQNCFIWVFDEFYVCFVFSYAYFMCVCPKTAIWLFWDNLWLFWLKEVSNPAVLYIGIAENDNGLELLFSLCGNELKTV